MHKMKKKRICFHFIYLENLIYIVFVYVINSFLTILTQPQVMVTLFEITKVVEKLI